MDSISFAESQSISSSAETGKPFLHVTHVDIGPRHCTHHIVVSLSCEQDESLIHSYNEMRVTPIRYGNNDHNTTSSEIPLELLYAVVKIFPYLRRIGRTEAMRENTCQMR